MDSPAIDTDDPAVAMLPAPVEIKLQPPAVAETVLSMQLPTAESHLSASFMSN